MRTVSTDGLMCSRCMSFQVFAVTSDSLLTWGILLVYDPTAAPQTGPSVELCSSGGFHIPGPFSVLFGLSLSGATMEATPSRACLRMCLCGVTLFFAALVPVVPQ